MSASITKEEAFFRKVLGTNKVWRCDAALLLSDKPPVEFQGAKIIDLRGPVKGKDLQGPNTVYAEIKNFNQYQSKENAKTTASNLADKDKNAETFESLYGEILSRSDNTASLKTIFKTLASEDKVFIVDSGNKDRVGVVSALISKAVGKSNTDIVNDYALSDKSKRDAAYNTKQVETLISHYQSTYNLTLDTASAERFLKAPSSAMKGFLTTHVTDIDAVLSKYDTSAEAVKQSKAVQ